MHRLTRSPRRIAIRALLSASCFAGYTQTLLGAEAERRPVDLEATGLTYIDTSIENASPLWYEQGADGAIHVHLVYDHERDAPNRATGHLHFLLHGQPGARLTLEFKNLANVWNGRPSPFWRYLRTIVTSPDGREWTPVEVEHPEEGRARVTLVMPGPRLYVARVEPYRLSDLERFLARIRARLHVQIEPIGRTVQGRELEIVRVGDPEAPHRVFIRARAHPWETGGNWVVEGLVDRLLADDPEARRFRERYCVYLMPMANKDGVVLGRTRFNLQGKDLNRDWNEPADPALAPENAALEAWLERMIANEQRPHLGLELHNDAGGRLHIARPPVPHLPRYLQRMEKLEALLRQHTWFTEGMTGGEFRNAGALGEGWLIRYGIDAVTHEFSANWIAGLGTYPLGQHWRDYGAGLATALFHYFENWEAPEPRGDEAPSR